MKMKRWLLVSIAVLGMVLFVAMTKAKESREKMTELPKLVMAAVQNLFPSATVEKTQPENISVAAFEVELKEGTEAKSAIVSSDGVVVSVESTVAAEALPEAVSKAISKNANGGKILIIEKEEIYMEARLVKLAQPKTTYEAKVTSDGKTYEITVDAAGTVLEMKAAEGDKEEKEGEEADDEQVVSLDSLPDVVKAAIVEASEGGTVKKVVSEKEDGQITYEAEVVISGQEFEIKVSADGKVLEKKAEKDDNGDDDQDDDDDDEDEDDD
jgi:uncharacterized membrane protein YkoI